MSSLERFRRSIGLKRSADTGRRPPPRAHEMLRAHELDPRNRAKVDMSVLSLDFDTPKGLGLGEIIRLKVFL